MKKISLMTMVIAYTTFGYLNTYAVCDGNFVNKPSMSTGVYQLPGGYLSGKSGDDGGDDDDDDTTDDDNRKPASSLSF
jgi:hypothetical protein